MGKIEVDGKKYDTSDLTDDANKLLNDLAKLRSAAEEKFKMIAVLQKAKLGYVSTLKAEMLSAKSGFDFSD